MIQPQAKVVALAEGISYIDRLSTKGVPVSPTPRKATKPSSRQSVVSWFKQYLDVNDQAKQEAERATELKDR